MPYSPEPVGLAGVLRLLWPPPAQITYSRVPMPWGGSVRYAPLPTPRRATLLVPTAPVAVSAAVMRSYKAPTSSIARARSRALELTARAGVFRLAPMTIGVQADDRTTFFVGHVGLLLGEQLVAGVHLGPPRANRKPVLQLVNRSGRTVAYAKVGINRLTAQRVLQEAEALQSLEGQEGLLSTPRLIAQGSWQGQPFLVTAPVQTWAAGGIDAEASSAALRALVASYPVTHESLQQSAWWLRMRQSLSDLESGAPAAELRALTARVEETVGREVLRFGAAHGDWSPWNIATVDGRTHAWDWERFLTDAPVGTDALHFAVQSAVRVDGATPAEAIARVRRVAPELAARNGADRRAGPVLLVAYLLELCIRLSLEQRHAPGSKRGPVQSWLLPGLRSAVGDLA